MNYPMSAISALNKNNINIIICQNLNKGINSYSYLLIDNKNNKYFLKIFLRNQINKHDRFKSELSFSNFLLINKFNNTPEILFHNKSQSWIVYKWIEGKRISRISKNHVEKLLQFLLSINNPKLKNCYLPLASEACFSLIEHKNLIYKRIDNTLSFLNQINLENKDEIIKNIRDRCTTINNYFPNKNNDKEGFFTSALKNHQRLITPSDVGFHNILVNKNQMYFLDFEYAGIDDPFKLISDLVLQPDYAIPNEYIYLLNKLIFKFKKDINSFEKKLLIILDLYILKWFCIILNPLIINKNMEVASKNLILRKVFLYLNNIENKKNIFIKTLGS
tara:strand:- start:1328 stop:2326 length:999 start_codon:yes stop_codon:yes gene_type:complete